MRRTSDETEVLRQFGERLRKLRLAHRLTQEEMAAKSGFSRSYYTEIETGKRNVSLLNLHKLSQTFKISLSELLNLE